MKQFSRRDDHAAILLTLKSSDAIGGGCVEFMDRGNDRNSLANREPGVSIRGESPWHAGHWLDPQAVVSSMDRNPLVEGHDIESSGYGKLYGTFPTAKPNWPCESKNTAKKEGAGLWSTRLASRLSRLGQNFH